MKRAKPRAVLMLVHYEDGLPSPGPFSLKCATRVSRKARRFSADLGRYQRYVPAVRAAERKALKIAVKALQEIKYLPGYLLTDTFAQYYLVAGKALTRISKLTGGKK